MDLILNKTKDKTVIKFGKDMVLGTEGVDFQNTIIDSLDNGVNYILIDLSNVEYITSWGIGMLVHAYTTTTKRNAKFSMEGVTQKVRDILIKIKLDTVLPIH